MGEAKRRRERKEDLEVGAIPVRERRLLSDEWRDYADRILKPVGVGPGSVQYIETRRAFMAGAIAFMGLLYTDTDAGPDFTQLDMDYVDALSAEFEQWERDLAEGRA